MTSVERNSKVLRPTSPLWVGLRPKPPRTNRGTRQTRLRLFLLIFRTQHRLPFHKRFNITENYNMEDIMDEEEPRSCSAKGCYNPGILCCSGCKHYYTYCSKECQKADWREHRKICLVYQPYNGFRIVARPATNSAVFENINAQLVPFHFHEYGIEGPEQEELKSKLKWTSASEVGKFYSHTGDDRWYYFVYGQEDAWEGKEPTLPKNELATKACGRDLWGDVVVIRSGPMGQDLEEQFSKADLARTLGYYKTKDSRAIFEEREGTRMGRNMHFDMSGMGGTGGMGTSGSDGSMDPMMEQYMRQAFMRQKGHFGYT